MFSGLRALGWARTKGPRGPTRLQIAITHLQIVARYMKRPTRIINLFNPLTSHMWIGTAVAEQLPIADSSTSPAEDVQFAGLKV